MYCACRLDWTDWTRPGLMRREHCSGRPRVRAIGHIACRQPLEHRRCACVCSRRRTAGLERHASAEPDDPRRVSVVRQFDVAPVSDLQAPMPADCERPRADRRAAAVSGATSRTNARTDEPQDGPGRPTLCDRGDRSSRGPRGIDRSRNRTRDRVARWRGPARPRGAAGDRRASVRCRQRAFETIRATRAGLAVAEEVRRPAS